MGLGLPSTAPASGLSNHRSPPCGFPNTMFSKPSRCCKAAFGFCVPSGRAERQSWVRWIFGGTREHLRHGVGLEQATGIKCRKFVSSGWFSLQGRSLGCARQILSGKVKCKNTNLTQPSLPKTWSSRADPNLDFGAWESICPASTKLQCWC